MDIQNIAPRVSETLFSNCISAAMEGDAPASGKMATPQLAGCDTRMDLAVGRATRYRLVIIGLRFIMLGCSGNLIVYQWWIVAAVIKLQLQFCSN